MLARPEYEEEKHRNTALVHPLAGGGREKRQNGRRGRKGREGEEVRRNRGRRRQGKSEGEMKE